MIVDSTALPEQAVRDIIASAFQSAGQRCSALRVLYLQEEIADTVMTMLSGAMDELSVGNPWQLSTDVGPVIDTAAQTKINNHVEEARAEVVAAGITINGLPILCRFCDTPARYPDLGAIYEERIIGGIGSFVVAAESEEDLAQAIRRKLILEISGTLPTTRVAHK